MTGSGTPGTTARSTRHWRLASSFAGRWVRQAVAVTNGGPIGTVSGSEPPDFHNEVVDLIVGGHRAAARLQYTGTHTGMLLGQSPTGRHFTYAGAAFFTASGERLTDAWVLGDLERLRAQLR
jgi:hypothetical protein